MKKRCISMVLILIFLTFSGCTRNIASEISQPVQTAEEDELDSILARFTKSTIEQRESDLPQQEILDWKQLGGRILYHYGFDVDVFWVDGSSEHKIYWPRSFILEKDGLLYIIVYQKYATDIGTFQVYHFYTRNIEDGSMTDFPTLNKQVQLSDLVHEIRRYFYHTGEYQIP